MPFGPGFSTARRDQEQDELANQLQAGQLPVNPSPGSYGRPVGMPAAVQDEKKYYQDFYKKYGYKLEARPYDFDPTKFSDPYYEKNAAQSAKMMEQYLGRKTPGMNLTNQTASRADQYAILQNLGTQYGDVISGAAPSLALQTIEGQRRQGLAQILALRGSARGGNVGASQRGAMYGSTALNTGLAEQAVTGRLQEVEAARAGLGQVGAQYGTVRGQDIALAAQQQQAQLETMRLNDAMTQYYQSIGLSLDQAQWAAQMHLQELQASQHQNAQATAKGVPGQASPAWALGGAAIGAAGAIGAGALAGSAAGPVGAGVGALAGAGVAAGQAIASDRSVKREIRGSAKDLREMLGKLRAYRYKYKDTVDTSGKDRFGIMAQDLEKSAAGKSLVVSLTRREGDTIKGVDTQMAVGTLLAAAADLHRRVNRIEARKGA